MGHRPANAPARVYNLREYKDALFEWAMQPIEVGECKWVKTKAIQKKKNE